MNKALVNYWVRRRRCLAIALMFLCLILMVVSYSYVPIIHNIFQEKESIICFRMKPNSTLPDIMEVSPRKGKSIFFHETSCNSYYKQKIVVTTRQACAVESAAKMNPNMDVYLLFTAPEDFQFEGTESDRILQALLTYDNIKIMHLNYENYTKGTPVEKLYKNGLIENSQYAIAHSSDVIRYLTLWKYGGIYFDLDVVILKSLEDLPPNYAGVESDDDVAAGVLSFDHTGEGHKLATDCVNDLKERFDGKVWGDSGPGVVTRLAQAACGTKNTNEMIKKDCKHFKVYPKEYFYPIHWTNWQMYFNEKSTPEILKMINNSYAIHVWNKISASTKVLKTADVPYLNIARKYCPKVVEQTQEFF